MEKDLCTESDTLEGMPPTGAVIERDGHCKQKISLITAEVVRLFF